MSDSASATVTATILLVHGSAADQTTWTIQQASLKGARLIAYDRRAEVGRSVEDQARDAVAVVAAQGGGGPVVGCGSSFGGVIVLEVLRSHPGVLAGGVLLEPPLPPGDDVPGVPVGFIEQFDRTVAEQGGPAAGELFLRTVLGDAALERMPRAFRERATGLWREIRADLAALAAYRVDYAGLHAITAPVLLLGGERSGPYYRPTLEALAAALGNATLEILPGAGHMMHAEAYRAFNARLLAFAAAASS